MKTQERITTKDELEREAAIELERATYYRDLWQKECAKNARLQLVLDGIARLASGQEDV